MSAPLTTEQVEEILALLNKATFAGIKRAVELPVADMRSLATELLALRKMVAWQDISTAPKDGTRILAESRGLVGISRWSERFAEHYGGDVSPGWYSEALDRRHEPTIWRALPTPKKPS